MKMALSKENGEWNREKERGSSSFVLTFYSSIPGCDSIIGHFIYTVLEYASLAVI